MWFVVTGVVGEVGILLPLVFSVMGVDVVCLLGVIVIGVTDVVGVGGSTFSVGVVLCVVGVVRVFLVGVVEMNGIGDSTSSVDVVHSFFL